MGPLGALSTGSEHTVMSAKVVIIAAMEREIAGLVRKWEVQPVSASAVGRSFTMGEAVVVCAGIGARAARSATERAVERYKPELLVSAGLAGSLVPTLRVPEAVIPATIVNSATGERYETGHGSGILVSASGVAGAQAKLLFARQYSAQLVDMEAASVAEVARQHGIAFTAVKAISDDCGFDVPDMEPFVDARGAFRMAKFVAHVAVHSRMWRTVRTLGANTRRAANELCTVLARVIDDATAQSGGHPVSKGKELGSR